MLLGELKSQVIYLFGLRPDWEEGTQCDYSLNNV